MTITDTDRLDWLESNKAGVCPVITVCRRPTTSGFGDHEHYGSLDGWAVTFFSSEMFPSVREAIDAAMRESTAHGESR